MGARLAVVGTVLVALTGLGTLSACSDDKSEKAAFVDAEKQAQQASLPKGDEETYLAALTKLDAKLTADKQAALDNGYNICTDFTNGMTTSETVIDAISLFSVDAKKGQKIVAIAKTNLCKPSASKGS
ncbi:DUF732 domain-containing protein [Actinoplanes sp. Pm04-4]|uniref:DUF732 domain-containing protein n=1 Tax=Paractinoplanes pyxinae TaxID=2997416 RepID=A0ABT4AZD5_9ACTN|nr:DUF732 domain-containing protein [Actinoplanes pyxinae]MCY1139607.1 DUF732 domain-containing protein [Actinoplanes pyxinae]